MVYLAIHVEINYSLVWTFTCYIKYIITCKNYSKMIIFEQHCHWLSMAISITCIIMAVIHNALA